MKKKTTKPSLNQAQIHISNLTSQFPLSRSSHVFTFFFFFILFSFIKFYLFLLSKKKKKKVLPVSFYSFFLFGFLSNNHFFSFIFFKCYVQFFFLEHIYSYVSTNFILSIMSIFFIPHVFLSLSSFPFLLQILKNKSNPTYLFTHSH